MPNDQTSSDETRDEGSEANERRSEGTAKGENGILDWTIAVVPGLGLGALMAWVCWLGTRSRGAGLNGLAGELTPTLGTFLGGLVVITTLVPGLTLAQAGMMRRFTAAVMTVVGLGGVWFLTTDRGLLTGGMWLKCFGVLVAYGLALAGLAGALGRMRLGKAGAAAVTILAGVMWLSWPIWLAPWLVSLGGEKLVDGLVAWHPLFALDGVLAGVFPSPWAQQHIAYVLTNIGDDISYALPGVAGCVVCHAVIGVGGQLVACVNRTRPIV